MFWFFFIVCFAFFVVSLQISFIHIFSCSVFLYYFLAVTFYSCFIPVLFICLNIIWVPWNIPNIPFDILFILMALVGGYHLPHLHVFFMGTALVALSFKVRKPYFVVVFSAVCHGFLLNLWLMMIVCVLYVAFLRGRTSFAGALCQAPLVFFFSGLLVWLRGSSGVAGV